MIMYCVVVGVLAVAIGCGLIALIKAILDLSDHYGGLCGQVKSNELHIEDAKLHIKNLSDQLSQLRESRETAVSTLETLIGFDDRLAELERNLIREVH